MSQSLSLAAVSQINWDDLDIEKFADEEALITRFEKDFGVKR